MEQINNFENQNLDQNLTPTTPPKNIFKLLFFILLALVLVITIFLTTFLITKNKNSVPVQKITETTEIIKNNVQDWKTVEDKEIGFSFNYHTFLGEFVYLPNKSETGNAILGKFSKNNDIYIGGISTDFTAGRSGSFYDFSGYDNKNNEITYHGARTLDKASLINKSDIKKIYKNKNGVEIVLINGYTPPESGYPEPWGLGEGNIGALVNTNNKTYPGISFQFPNILESEMIFILDSFDLTK